MGFPERPRVSSPVKHIVVSGEDTFHSHLGCNSNTKRGRRHSSGYSSLPPPPSSPLHTPLKQIVSIGTEWKGCICDETIQQRIKKNEPWSANEEDTGLFADFVEVECLVLAENLVLLGVENNLRKGEMAPCVRGQEKRTSSSLRAVGLSQMMLYTEPGSTVSKGPSAWRIFTHTELALDTRNGDLFGSPGDTLTI